jgi:hypothetical protein
MRGGGADVGRVEKVQANTSANCCVVERRKPAIHFIGDGSRLKVVRPATRPPPP